MANKVPLLITKESDFLSFLHSDMLYRLLEDQRPRLDFFKCSVPEQEALKEIWKKGVANVGDNEQNVVLVRCGWVSSENGRIFLHCPLSKQLILMAMHKNIHRPSADLFHNLPEFIQQFLSILDSTWMKQTMTKDESGTILESIWQKEFYRIGSQILRNSSTISVEVSRGQVGGQDFKTCNGAKLDFYINGDRQWAIEFLIRGELTNKQESRAKEHEQRFREKYKSIPYKQCLLLDFRPRKFGPYDDFQDLHNNLLPRTVFLPNYWIVVYDEKSFEEMRVTKYDQNGNFLECITLQLVQSVECMQLT